MRQIVLDTETTGLSARTGDRIVEVGCVELVDRKPTGRRLHRYLNPEREVPIEAQRIHGLTDEFLADKPKFRDVAAELADFIREAELVIHNAAFDMEFLDTEFGLLGNADMESANRLCASVVDTLKMARDMRPGKRNSLDALCVEYGVDNSNRQFHGALLDAQLLAEVYLAMTRGQESLIMEFDQPAAGMISSAPGLRSPLRVVRATEAELAEHEQVIEEIDRITRGNCVWKLAAGMG